MESCSPLPYDIGLATRTLGVVGGGEGLGRMSHPMCRLPLAFPSLGMVLCPHTWFCLVFQFQNTSGSSLSKGKHSYFSQGHGRHSRWLGRPRRKPGDLVLFLSLSLSVSLPICLSPCKPYLHLCLQVPTSPEHFCKLVYWVIIAMLSVISLLISPLWAKFSANYLCSTSLPTFKTS